VADARLRLEVGSCGASLVVEDVFSRRYATFDTFNPTQGAGDRPERFPMPGQLQTTRVMLRRGFGASAPAGH
jgi:hypothetical protein